MRMNLIVPHVIIAYDVTPWPSCLGLRCRPKRSFLAGSRCGLVFWRPASVYLHGVPSLDQNGRLYSIGVVKTWRLVNSGNFTWFLFYESGHFCRPDAPDRCEQRFSKNTRGIRIITDGKDCNLLYSQSQFRQLHDIMKIHPSYHASVKSYAYP